MTSSSFLNQVDASEHLARERVTRARTIDDDQLQARLLAQSVEWAVRAVLTAWGAPAAKPERLWGALEDSLRACLDRDVIAWAHNVRAERADAVGTLLQNADPCIDAIVALADHDPPVSWSPPERAIVGWDVLTTSDRDILSAVQVAARTIMPDATIWLFGSRATGSANVDSDYDLLLIVPDDTPDALRGRALGEMWLVANDYGVTAHRTVMTMSTWSHPDSANLTLVTEVRAFGIQIPNQ
jgi:hypothetical protein